MCNHCNNLFSGNSCDPFILRELKVNDIHAFTILTFLADDDDRTVNLQTMMLDLHGETVSEGQVPVKCCPVCGREFLC